MAEKFFFETLLKFIAGQLPYFLTSLGAVTLLGLFLWKKGLLKISFGNGSDSKQQVTINTSPNGSPGNGHSNGYLQLTQQTVTLLTKISDNQDQTAKVLERLVTHLEATMTRQNMLSFQVEYLYKKAVDK